MTSPCSAELKRLLAEHPGDAGRACTWGKQVLRLPDQLNVDARNGLVGELRVLLGRGPRSSPEFDSGSPTAVVTELRSAALDRLD